MQLINTPTMKIKQEYIDRINGNPKAKPALMMALKKSRQLINRMVKQNKSNGQLTSFAALDALSVIFDLSNASDMIDTNTSTLPKK